MFRRLLLPILLLAAVAAEGRMLPAELRGGHFATLTLVQQFVDARTEEWEAFLSVDGGRFYSVRLTPHLERSVRSYDVFIPNVESSDARLLIRTGNEVVETLHEVAQPFRIRADRDAVLPLARAAAHAPEAARPGEADVVVWCDGGRINSTAAMPPGCRAGIHDSVDIAWDTNLPHTAAETAVVIVSRPLNRERHHIPAAARYSHDILLLTTRLNV